MKNKKIIKLVIINLISVALIVSAVTTSVLLTKKESKKPENQIENLKPINNLDHQKNKTNININKGGVVNKFKENDNDKNLKTNKTNDNKQANNSQKIISTNKLEKPELSLQNNKNKNDSMINQGKTNQEKIINEKQKNTNKTINNDLKKSDQIKNNSSMKTNDNKQANNSQKIISTNKLEKPELSLQNNKNKNDSMINQGKTNQEKIINEKQKNTKFNSEEKNTNKTINNDLKKSDQIKNNSSMKTNDNKQANNSQKIISTNKLEKPELSLQNNKNKNDSMINQGKTNQEKIINEKQKNTNFNSEEKNTNKTINNDLKKSDQIKNNSSMKADDSKQVNNPDKPEINLETNKDIDENLKLDKVNDKTQNISKNTSKITNYDESDLVITNNEDNILKQNDLFIKKLTYLFNDLNKKYFLYFEFNANKLTKENNTLSFSINNIKKEINIPFWKSSLLVEINSSVNNLKNEINDIVLNNFKITTDNLVVKKINFTNLNINNLNFNSYEVNYQENKLTINLTDNIYEQEDYFIATVVPKKYNPNFSLNLLAKLKNNKIIIENINDLRYYYDEFYIAKLFSIDQKKEVSISEFYSFKLTNSVFDFLAYDPKKSEIKKIIGKNEFQGKFELLHNLNNLFFKNKYFVLTFTNNKVLEKKQNYIEYSDSIATGISDHKINDKSEFNKKIFLTFEDLKNFKINNLPENNLWILTSIEMVYKEDLSKIISINSSTTQSNKSSNFFSNNNFPFYYKNNSSKPPSKNKFELQTELINENINYTNTVDENILKQYNINQLNSEEVFNFKNLNNNLNIPLTFNNYLKLNDYFLKETQKKIDLQQEDNKNKITDFNLINNDVNVNYNWVILWENAKEKQFTENNDKTIYTIKKNLSQMSEILNEASTLVNFNFFGDTNLINNDKWQINHNSYNLTFSLKKLKEIKKIDNIKINFLVDWKQIYANRNQDSLNKTSWGYTQNSYEKLKVNFIQAEELINQRLKASVELIDNEIVIKLQARKGIISKDIYYHNLSQKISTFIELNQNYLSLMYIENSKNLQLPESKTLVSKNNKWNFKTIKNENSGENNYKFEINTRILKNNQNSTSNQVKMRSFANDEGSLWLIGKVSDNINDNRYYVGTNIHVPVDKKSVFLAIPKDQENIDDNQSTLSYFEWEINPQVVWKAHDNTLIDARKAESKDRSNADFKVVIIDISKLLDYYNQNKNKSEIEKNADKNFLIAKHFYNWKNLTDIKVSNKAKYLLKNNLIFDSYISAFPNDVNKTIINNQEKFIRNNIQLIMRYGSLLDIASIFDNNFSDNFGMYNEKNNHWQNKSYLFAGSSGSGVYDNEGNIYGIHNGIINGRWATVLLNTQKINFLGEYNEFNQNSFASWIQQANYLYPNKYRKLNSFIEFDNPLNK